jgi:hypothetical protein
MTLPNIFSNRQFKRIAIAVAIFFLVVLLINVFVIGGGAFVFTFNGILNSPLAIITAVSAAAIWRLMSAEKNNRLLWSGIVLGWGLWAIAETIWAAYSILEKEVPYPSVADLFWVAGYIPMGYGLIARIRTMPAKPNSSQLIQIIGASVITVIITYLFIFAPILRDLNPQFWIENILNFIYPLADLILLTIVWRLFFAYEEGTYGFVWRILTVGFILQTISDFIFTYASWKGLYYPDMQANILSRLAVDIPYTTAYLLWVLSIHALRILLKEETPRLASSRIRLVRNYGHILVYTRNDDTVIDVSPNFNRFFQDGNVKGKPLANALTLPEQDVQAFMEKLRKGERMTDLPLKIQNLSGVLQDVYLNGMAIHSPQKEYQGSNLLLRMRTADHSFDDVLNDETKALAKYLLEKSGSSSKMEVAQFLSDYYLAYIKSLLDMASHQGGTALAQTLLDQLQKTAERNNWPIQFNLDTIMEHTKCPLEVLIKALPELLETAKQFVSAVTGPVAVETRLREVSSQFNESIHQDAEYYRTFGSKL